VWVRKCLNVSFCASSFNSGRYFVIGASRSRSPRPARIAAARPVYDFVDDAM
jgi:hypothetical protein